MTKLLLYIFGGLLTVSIIFGAHTFYSKWQLNKANNTLNEQLMQANLDIGKAHTQFGNAQNKIKELDKDLQVALKKNGELISAYGKLKAEYKASGKENVNPEIVYVEGPAIEVPVELNLKRGKLYQAITNKTLVELDQFSAEYNDNRISILCLVKPTINMNRRIPMGIGYDFHLRLEGQFIQSYTKSGAVNHYFNLWEVDEKGKKLGKFSVKEFEVTVQKPDEKSFFWWSPKLDAGAFVGSSFDLRLTSGASVGFSTSGYGYTKNDLSWRFVRLGVDFSDNKVGLSLSPALYNLGNVLPLISNLFLGPYVSFNNQQAGSVGLNLSVGL
jgi:hypothetical protein